MLDLRRLSVFREVADRGSFSGAALALDYTQSVVSHHVAQLEHELGVTLVERGRRPVRLTPAGERLHEHAATILGAARAAETDLRAIAGLEAGTLRMAAFLSACATFVPAAIGAFAAEHPGVQVELHQQEPPASIPRLLSGELDVVVAWIQHGDESTLDPRIEHVKLRDDPYRLVLSPTHRLARRRTVGLADLRDEAFSGPRPVAGGLEYRAMLERLCRAEGYTPNITHLVDDVSVARALVAAGLCVGVMPDMTVPHPRPDVAVKPLEGIDPFRTVHALWLKGRRTPGIVPIIAALRKSA